MSAEYFYLAMKNGPQHEGCGEIVEVERDEYPLFSEESFDVKSCGSDGYLCPECEPDDEDAAFWREMARSSDEEWERPEFPDFD